MDSDAEAAGSGRVQTLSHRLGRIAVWLGGVVLVLAVLDLLGVPALDWIRDLLAWDVVFAIVLVSWVFGWSGGKQLVESSYAEAKTKSREMRSKEKSRA